MHFAAGPRAGCPPLQCMGIQLCSGLPTGDANFVHIFDPEPSGRGKSWVTSEALPPGVRRDACLGLEATQKQGPQAQGRLSGVHPHSI